MLLGVIYFACHQLRKYVVFYKRRKKEERKNSSQDPISRNVKNRK